MASRSMRFSIRKTSLQGVPDCKSFAALTDTDLFSDSRTADSLFIHSDDTSLLEGGQSTACQKDVTILSPDIYKGSTPTVGAAGGRADNRSAKRGLCRAGNRF